MPFRDVAGPRRLLALLARSIRGDTLPPSLIFAGPPGAGKCAAAIATAQSLNCLSPLEFTEFTNAESSSARLANQQPRAVAAQAHEMPGVGIDACGVCAACTRIARGVHPDVPILEPGENGSIRIDQVREVVERAGYRPFEGRRRVVIIDQADTLVVAAQNALLKTLEEPPSSSIFILVSARPDMLLATVQSRCPRLRFPAMAREEIDADAREVAERVLLGAATNADQRVRLEAAKDLLTNTGAGGAADREQVASHLRAMATLLRDVELLSTRADTRHLANGDVAATLGRLAAYQGERGMRAFSAVDQALAALDRNAGVKIVADWLALQL